MPLRLFFLHYGSSAGKQVFVKQKVVMEPVDVLTN